MASRLIELLQLKKQGNCSKNGNKEFDRLKHKNKLLLLNFFLLSFVFFHVKRGRHVACATGTCSRRSGIISAACVSVAVVHILNDVLDCKLCHYARELDS